VGKPSGGAGRFSTWIAKARQYQEKLEKRPWIAFPLDSVRRFNKIEGKHLAIVIALNLFVAVIPLIIIGYAFIEAFTRIAMSATCWHRTST
jgi:uncharacterized BrkB/YihY/UPF0761 family membrane protein